MIFWYCMLGSYLCTTWIFSAYLFISGAVAAERNDKGDYADIPWHHMAVLEYVVAVFTILIAPALIPVCITNEWWRRSK